MKPQTIVYLGLILLGITITISAIDPMKPESELIPNEEKDISITKGRGPRHMVFNKDGKLAYVLNELSGAVDM